MVHFGQHEVKRRLYERGTIPLCQPLFHLFEKVLVKLVDQFIAGGDQALDRVWKGFIFPHEPLEGLWQK